MFKHPYNWSPAPFTVFKNTNLKEEVEKEGFVVVDFIDPVALSKVKDLYDQEHDIKDDTGGMFYSVYSQDISYRERIHNKLNDILTPSFNSFFVDYNNGINFFINKLSGDNSGFSLHQDSSAIDELKYSSLSVWIPLQDVDETNGALWVVEKTHRLFSPYRSISFPPPFAGIKETIKDYLKPVSLKAGQALIFDSRILHTSGKNLSGKDRIAVVSGILPLGTSFQLSYQDSENDPIEIYAQDDQFLINYPNFFHDCVVRPTLGHKIGEAPFVFPKITREEFEMNCASLEIKKVNLFEEIEPAKNFLTEPVPESPTDNTKSGIFSKLKTLIK